MDIRMYLRQKFNNKVRPLFIKDECECCGENKNLELHHDDKHFVEMLDETLELLSLKYKEDTDDYSQQELQSINLIMLGMQVDSKYLTVCRKCHDEIHSEIGINTSIHEKRKVNEKIKYANIVLAPYLETIVSKKLNKYDLEDLKKQFIQGNIKSRTMGINSINKLMKENSLPYILEYKRKSIRNDDGKIGKISHWEINRL